MKKNTAKFTESLDLQTPTPEDLQTYERQIKSYSIHALKTAAVVDKIYVQHTQFANLVGAMERVFQIAPEFDVPNGMLLLGPPGTGKSAAFQFFRGTLPSSSLFTDGDGAVGLRCPKRPRVGHFVTALLKAYRYPFAHGSAQQMYMRRGILFDAIREKGTRLIFVDESQNMLRSRSASSSHDGDTEVSEFFREMMDECKIALVLSGSQELDAVAGADTALASRLTVRETLSNIELGAQWMAILHAFGRQCSSFDLSGLEDPKLATLLHRATQGNLRSLKRLLIEAVLIAVDAKQNAVDVVVFSKAFGLVFGSAHAQPNVFV